jgi:hypothetical protein
MVVTSNSDSAGSEHPGGCHPTVPGRRSGRSEKEHRSLILQIGMAAVSGFASGLADGS